MSQSKEKTAPTVERGSGKTGNLILRNAGFTPVSHNFTSSGGKSQSPGGCLMDFLGTGRNGAITAAKLAELSGCSLRDISRSVEALRRRGVPICASCHTPRGYYLPADPQELRQYIATLDGRIKEVKTTRAACMAALEQMSGQEFLGEDF